MGLDTRRTKTSRLARHVGLAFQKSNDQFFKFRVQDEIEVGARALGRYNGAWLQELVALFQLEPLLGRSPYRLSEGEKKRVGFASALAARPEILVLDEPTTGQDWPFRRALGQLLGDLGERGQTVVIRDPFWGIPPRSLNGLGLVLLPAPRLLTANNWRTECHLFV